MNITDKINKYEVINLIRAAINEDLGGYGDITSKLLIPMERIYLNFLQPMSGIATYTKKFSSIASEYNIKIADTRKTKPGLRKIEKYAVICGGGFNHRFGLFDGILIKDNHIIE